ncbi:MAG: MFS transporter [Prochloraceae cyanobacterium]|nr:MFS transporter [Prochloraceae cyanobacterium]
MSDFSATESASNQTPIPEKLNFSTKLAYGAGDLGPAMTANILVFFLLFFFTNVAGLPPGIAGSILTIGKISDAINDPIIGILSDRTRSRWGRRLPWIFWGIIPFGILFFLQWIVPRFSDNNTVNNWWLFGYYVLIGVLFNFAYTIVNLPYTALTPELTEDYNERTSLNSFRFTFSIGGSILSLIIAGLISAYYKDDPVTQYLVLGLVCSLLSVIALLWCVLRIQERRTQSILNERPKKTLGIVLSAVGFILIIYGILRLIPLTSALLGVSEGLDLYAILAILIGLQIGAFGLTLIFSDPETHLTDRSSSNNSVAETEDPLPFVEQLKIVFSNKPFRYVIGMYLCSWLGVQLTASILIYFVVSWMGLDPQAFPSVAIAVQGTALVMLFVWKTISDRIGKKAVYFIGTSIWIIAQIGLFSLQPSQVELMYFLAVLAGFGVSVAYLIPWSMLPDVIELDELTTGQRREGIFYSFAIVVQKFCLAFALFLVGIALEWAGFIERIPGQPIPVQPENALLAIRIAVAPLPAVVLIIGLVLAYFYPLTGEIHAEIRLKLQERRNNRG